MTADTTNQPQRTVYLDGLRGCAALMVLLGHLTMMAWQGVILTEIYPPATPSWELALASSPLSALWDGRLAVAIFFILSGYVLTAATAGRRLALPALIAKRYLRLALPVLAATLPTLLLLPAGFYLNHELSYVTGSPWLNTVTATGFEPGFWHWLKTALWTVFFIDGHTSYNALLWTMQFEFWGSLLVFVLTSLIGDPRWRLCAAFVALAILGEWPDYALLHLFMAGMLLHDLTGLARDRGLRRGTVLNSTMLNGSGIILVAAGLYLPRLVAVLIATKGDGLAGLLWLRQALPSWQGDRWMLAAFLILAGLILSPGLQRLLASGICRFLGRISFPLYLFHLPVIMSFGSWLMLTLLARLDFALAVWLSMIVTSLVALLVAWIMTWLIEQPSLLLSARAGAVVNAWWARRPAWCQLGASRRPA